MHSVLKFERKRLQHQVKLSIQRYDYLNQPYLILIHTLIDSKFHNLLIYLYLKLKQLIIGLIEYTGKTRYVRNIAKFGISSQIRHIFQKLWKVSI